MISNIKDRLLSELSALSDGGFSVGIGFRGCIPHWAYSNYPELWQKTYIEQGYLEQDPTITHGNENSGYFTWKELSELYPGSPVWDAARGFGLGVGSTISVQISGVRTIASFSGPAFSATDLARAKASVFGLHGLFAPEDQGIVLPGKVVEVLKLMARGFRDKEIAERLSLKIESIRRRRLVAHQVTGTRTIPELMSLVTKNGLI